MNELEDVYGKTKLWQQILFVIICIIGIISFVMYLYTAIFLFSNQERLLNIVSIGSIMYIMYHIGYEVRGKKYGRN